MLAISREYLSSLPDRPVGRPTDPGALRAALGGPLPDAGEDPVAVIDALARAAAPGIVASAGPRYFGFVVGGALPAALAADWLTATWDQLAGLYVSGPAAAAVEEVVAGWLLELLGLPPRAGVGFVTGAQMANFTALAAARDALLRRSGWDVGRGLAGAPEIDVIVGEEAHATVPAALHLLGLASATARRCATDDQGAMCADALVELLEDDGRPAIVCAQAGNVNTGACDPLDAIAMATRARGAWLHVDGAFGLWAAASPRRRGLVAGLEQADSWATDAHKWLNVPYDSGVAVVADPAAHRAAMGVTAAYLAEAPESGRDNHEWTPEASRRARGFPIYAALRSLGRSGVAELVDRCCDLARRMADRLSAEPGVEILNDVVLNQVLVGFAAAGEHDLVGAVIDRVQRDGTCWVGGTTWRGRHAIRISISNWSTTEADVDRSADAILSAARAGRD